MAKYLAEEFGLKLIGKALKPDKLHRKLTWIDKRERDQARVCTHIQTNQSHIEHYREIYDRVRNHPWMVI